MDLASFAPEPEIWRRDHPGRVQRGAITAESGCRGTRPAVDRAGREAGQGVGGCERSGAGVSYVVHADWGLFSTPKEGLGGCEGSGFK